MKKTALSLSIFFSFNAISADISEIFKQSEMHDPQLSVAKHTLEATTEGKKQAFAAFLPQINASLGNGRSKSKTVSSFSQNPASYNESSSWGINLSQSLYNHANYQNYRISELQIVKSTADYDLTYLNFILRVAQNYFNSLAAKDSLVFSKAEEKAIKRQLEQAEQRFEVGLAAITDVHEARARYDSARASVILAKNQVQDSNEALFEMSQQYYLDLKSVPNNLPYDSFKMETLDSYQKTGLVKNPELISSGVNKDISEKQIEVSKSGHYPNASLSFGRNQSFSPDKTEFGVVNGSLQQFNTGSSTSDSNSISLSFNIPIYSGGRTASQVRQSAHNHGAAMDRYEQTRRSVIRKIRNAYHGTLAAKSTVQARKQAMISAQSGLEATEAGYEVGTRTIVDVLNSQRSLYQAQRDYSQAKYEYFIKFLTLKKDSGSLSANDISTINNLLQ